MDGNANENSVVIEQDDYEYSPENSGDSPGSSIFNDNKVTSTSSPKGSRRAMQKRVVSVPIKDVEGSRGKGEMSAPPSDSWAWRKYGQKPIKGSPYPRGYYRCSSSKGCPARKQVERSRVDPNMIIVTYSYEHNHPWPASRNHHRTTTTPAVATSTSAVNDVNDANPISDSPVSNSETKDPTGFTDQRDEEKFPANLGEFGWFAADFESPPPPSSTMLESPISAEERISDADTATIFSMREEDESLFADLGELPECSVVFRSREAMERECTLTSWCGTTG